MRVNPNAGKTAGINTRRQRRATGGRGTKRSKVQRPRSKVAEQNALGVFVSSWLCGWNASLGRFETESRWFGQLAADCCRLRQVAASCGQLRQVCGRAENRLSDAGSE